MDAARVLIVDDHALVGAGLVRMLEAEGLQPHWCGDTAAALDALRDAAWQVVLLDVSLPGGDGLDLLKRIKATHPRLPVLMLSMHAEHLFALRALRGGAAGYLTKDSAPDVLLDAIRAATQGKRYLTATVAEQLAHHFQKGAAADAPAHQTLSDRELQVLLRIGAGRTVGEVARELHLSVKTVSTHKTRLMQKMHLERDADLVRYVLDHELA
ncbi:MAG: response regulator [Thiomonas sp.]|jgi:DNA-binding NarL/FixJ family response regulator|nr:MAG: DNA-binding response regulator [Thiomonas sp. 15-63-373]